MLLVLPVRFLLLLLVSGIRNEEQKEVGACACMFCTCNLKVLGGYFGGFGVIVIACVIVAAVLCSLG